LGVLIDRLGARLMLTLGAVTASLGGILFALATGLWPALVARALIGGGVAVAYIGTLKLVGAWFPLQRFGLLAGLTLAAGTAGAVGAQVPLSLVVDTFGWRPTLLMTGIVGLGLALSIVAVVRNAPPAAAEPTAPGGRPETPAAAAPPTIGLTGILLRRETWLLIIVTGLTGAPILAFAGLWGVPYFVQVHGFERTTAASLTSLMLIAWAVGGPGLGAVADRVASRARLILLVGAANALLWLPFALYPTLPMWLVVPLILALGLGGGAMIVAFAVVRTVFGTTAAGQAFGIVNTSVLLFGAGTQTLFGVVLDWYWTGETVAGNRVYDAPAYATGFILFSISAGLVVAAGAALTRVEMQHAADRGHRRPH
jgi:MFS family permease